VKKNVVEIKVVYSDSPAARQEIMEWLSEPSDAELRLIAVYQAARQGGTDSARQKLDRFLQELEMLQ
jgi:hypothetical protein